ncbi:hypothetical protein ABZZ37_04085 [Streptomyces sp. NPDC006464]|uniref:hypothetical protein n=1 Tax=Streptomyces sp. NPDC006464 TaxID=3154305 RepID=UPI0033B2C0C0
MPRPPVTAPRSAPYTALLAALTLVLSLLLPILPVGPAGTAHAEELPALADCVTVPVNEYGTAPTATTSAETCKAFTAATTGPYDVFGVAPVEGRRARLAVYDAAGAAVCAPEGACRLTAGDTYRVITDQPTLILDRSSTQGCSPTAPGRHTGALEAPGAIDCLTLSLPAEAHVEALTPLKSPHTVEVVDGTGTKICAAGGLAAHTCELTGPAPHRALVSTTDVEAPTGTYHLALHRTDVPDECQAIPAGDFTSSTPKATVALAADVFSYCFTIPADDHSAHEFIRPEALDGTWISTGAATGEPTRWSQAEHTVLDAEGVRVCDTNCALAPGTAYTVLVRTALRDKFSVVRRDVTGTARGCPAQSAVPAGGSSSSGPLGFSGTVSCHQVTTDDAGDAVYLDATAQATVYDGSGRGTPCAGGCTVTGTTHYQVVMTAPYRPAPTYRLDAMRISTPAGPAPQCARVLNLRDGYGPVTGTLDDEHVADCVSLPTASNDDLWVWVRDPAGTAYTAVASLWDAELNDTCRDERGGSRCTLGGGSASTAPSPSILVLGRTATRTSYRAEVECNPYTTRLCGGVPVSVSSVTPTSAPRGSLATLTVHGSALSIKDTVQLTKDGRTLTAKPVAVSPDGRSLTVTVGLSVAVPGDWSVRVAAFGKVYPAGTFTVTPAVSGLGSYVPLPPTRVMDTRYGINTHRAKVGPGETIPLLVTQGYVPNGVSAVVLNVTATGPSTAGFVSVYPDGTPRASASNLNFKAGQTIPNLVVVPVINGYVNFYNKAGYVDLVADVAGYYVTDGSGATFKPAGPTRLMDTRDGTGVAKAKVGAQGSVTLKVTGTGGIPTTDVKAVVLNVTATSPTAASFVSVHPADQSRSSASNLNFSAGQTIPNLVVVPVGKDGDVTFYNHAGSVDLIADLAGYFTMDATGSGYRPLAPTRLMDTRDGTGVAKAKVGAQQTVTLEVAGRSGIPATGVTAVIMNVTAVAPTAGSFVSVFPDGVVRPSASNLNFTAGTTIPNLVVVPVVNGKVNFYNHAGSVDLLADVAGYYTS